MGLCSGVFSFFYGFYECKDLFLIVRNSKLGIFFMANKQYCESCGLEVESKKIINWNPFAVSDTEKSCPYCGLRQRNRGVEIFACSFFSVVLTIAVFLNVTLGLPYD